VSLPCTVASFYRYSEEKAFCEAPTAERRRMEGQRSTRSGGAAH
jgi:hypothetical protein